MFSEADMIEYISSDDLAVEDEALVFEFVKKWIGVDPQAREKSVTKIMKHVRFSIVLTILLVLCDWDRPYYAVKGMPPAGARSKYIPTCS